MKFQLRTGDWLNIEVLDVCTCIKVGKWDWCSLY